jgi:dynein heavy chain
VEQRQHTYVTPTSYLDLIKTFQGLLLKQKTSLFDKKLTYEEGIQKLAETNASVKVLEEELRISQP